MEQTNKISFKEKFVAFLNKQGTRSVISSLVCVAGGLIVGFIILVLLAVFNENISFGEAIRGIITILGGPFSAGNSYDALYQTGNMLFRSTPLIMTGLSVALAFKTGLFNIGAPGQYLMGAMGSLIVALSIPTDKVPAWIVWILALLAGVLLGALWGAIPGMFKAFFNVNEVIVCIMTNWIAANVVSWIFNATKQQFVNFAETKVNFIKKTITNGVATATLGLDKVFGNSYMDVSIFIAATVAVILYFVINKTTFGYELKACGYNKHASKYAGMNEKKYIILSMVIAGALAAAGAALWCLNGAQDFKWDTYQTLPADGFNGIPAALLASNNPIGVIFSSIFLRYLNAGGANLSSQTSFNESVSSLIIAVIIYFSAFSKFIKELLNKRMKKRLDKQYMLEQQRRNEELMKENPPVEKTQTEEEIYISPEMLEDDQDDDKTSSEGGETV